MGRFGHYVLDADGHGGEPLGWRRRIPAPYLDQMLEQGRSGMASGAGFRDWDAADLAATKERVAAHLKKLEKILPK